MGKSPKLSSVSVMANTLWWPDGPVEVKVMFNLLSWFKFN
jgi:hypothetical protein